MSSTKAALKAAKQALDAGKYVEASAEVQKVLQSDGSNYFALLFLGRASEMQDKVNDAAQAYHAAAKSKPDDTQAWLGLCSLYETQGSEKVDEYREVAMRVAELYAVADDKHRCQGVVDKLVTFTKDHGTLNQNKKVLESLLPNSSIYNTLEGRLPHPGHTYVKLAEMTEQDDLQRIQREIGNRRTRIGARINEVTQEVKSEVYKKSRFEDLCRQVINWSTDDDIRRLYEEKLLMRSYDTLVVLPIDKKSTQLSQVLDLAEGMVIIHHHFQLAWDLVLETRDSTAIDELDANLLREYVASFPHSGLAKILDAFLGTDLSPFPIPTKEEETEEEDGAKMTAEERLLAFTDGLEASSSSTFAYRLACLYYLHLEEYRVAVETSRHGLSMLESESRRLGMSLQNTRNAIETVLATALVHHEAPRNHEEAERLFEKLLHLDPNSTPAKIGRGMIFIERENFDNARAYLAAALEQDTSNLQVKIELAWCEALLGNFAQALASLDEYLPQLKGDDLKSKDMRALVNYRAGMCLWELDPLKQARKNRSGAYSRFLSAIRASANFAPAYTMLGMYYGDYAKDRKRARQCFQKSFELSAAETVAAERLAKSFADQGDWDIVEVIAQRVVDSGKARPPPGSRKKGISWPYSALGVVQMNKLEYQKAISSFLAALRISPDDYQSYVGLGESYHNSGRYNSALRTFAYALEPPEGAEMKVTGEKWFARYMLANVHRELGAYDEAINGLRLVLNDRPHEFGVLVSLLQTLVDQASQCLEIGHFGRAIEVANEALITAAAIADQWPSAFNLWKAVGDAAMIFSTVHSAKENCSKDKMMSLLVGEENDLAYSTIREVDHISVTDLQQQTNGSAYSPELPTAVIAGILAFKRAIYCSSNDIHAQAVAWYNLGWAEQRAHCRSTTSPARARDFLKAAVRCFKRAIELEAGNAEFWNALGVVTSTLNPKVAQHSFVRSLHLNELNAKVWANLGVLYLLQGDNVLAHQAFGRAQSTDPTYGHAWMGEGIIALLLGNTQEAMSHFTHAFEISQSSSVIGQRLYTQSIFDYLLSAPQLESNNTSLIQPLFALRQLQSQVPADLPYKHLAALFLERTGDLAVAIDALTELCGAAEAEYEASESNAALVRFIHAKSDLARCQLAARLFNEAASNAETALDLLVDAESSGVEEGLRQQIRTSSHLTAGLSQYYQSRLGDAISMFKFALRESSDDPSITCLLVKVLWAQGGQEERMVARDQLFECVEKYPEHVASVTLLGAMAALDNDADAIAAVSEDLQDLRTKQGLSTGEADQIETVIAALAAIRSDGEERAFLGEAQAATLLRPDRPQPWTELAHASGDEHTSIMALQTAENAIPPNGDVKSTDLARVLAGRGAASTAQRAIALAPWQVSGWETLEASTMVS